ncbi:nuclear transport factor 2 family protein [Sphingomonas sp. LM7]|uniref:nuclear transport factor 2 family protein n=1 Tax=Sphingomonas sp. LM7 TaxID=1938607 RepID=UPI000983BFB4|nr:nuclear transport factor 2 family protein [Sphingomonas sp. LM7]AQR72356.1 hypothetical protein BXU08_00555 [Sphingomonas sp. LM7]
MKHWISALALLGLPAAAAAQQAPADEAAVRAADTSFWAAFNACDAKTMDRFFTDDVEFYHDRTGLTAGRAVVVASLINGPCGTPGLHVRREGVARTLRYDPVPRTGAILTGEHRFYAKQGAASEQLDGQASFANIWVRDGSGWKMRRVLSYAHGPVR